MLVVLGWLMGVRWGSALVLAEKHVAESSGPFACRGKELGDLIAAGRCSRSVPSHVKGGKCVPPCCAQSIINTELVKFVIRIIMVQLETA